MTGRGEADCGTRRTGGDRGTRRTGGDRKPRPDGGHTPGRGGDRSTRTSALERLALFVREDARDVRRERQAHVLGGLFVLVGGGMAYSAGRSVTRAGAGVDVALAPRLLGPLALLIPLVALGFVAPVLVERRTTGALAVLLGLPFSRRTVVLGTFLGRSLALGAAVVGGTIVALPIALALGVTVDPLRVVATTVALVCLAITFVAVAIAISAVARTSTRASFTAFGTYVVFVFQLWESLPMVALYVRHGFAFPETTPTWVAFVASLNPITAFTNALGGVFPSLANAALASAPDDPAAFERPTVAVAVLVAWIVAALAVGSWRFRATDL